MFTSFISVLFREHIFFPFVVSSTLVMCFFCSFPPPTHITSLPIPPFLNWFQLMFPTLRLCHSPSSLLYNVSDCFFLFFHKLHPDWILPVAQLHLYNKAYILGYSLSTRLPSHWITPLYTFDHIPIISQNTVNYHLHSCSTFSPVPGAMGYMNKTGTMQVCKKNNFQAPSTSFGQGSISLS